MRLYQIKINENHKENFIKLFGFIFLKINKFIFFRLYAFLTFVCLMLRVMGIMRVEIHLIVLIYILLFLFSISLTIEEVFHCVILIIQGRKSEVDSLCFNMVRLKGRNIIAIGVSIFFNGSFSANDILNISLAGPGVSLIIGIASVVLFSAVNGILFLLDIKNFLYLIKVVAVGLLFLPIVSFFPFSNNFIETDGFKIFRLKKKNKLTNKDLFKALVYIYKYSISYINQSLV